jgi:hypothetical protein
MNTAKKAATVAEDLDNVLASIAEDLLTPEGAPEVLLLSLTFALERSRTLLVPLAEQLNKVVTKNRGWKDYRPKAEARIG